MFVILAVAATVAANGGTPDRRAAGASRTGRPARVTSAEWIATATASIPKQRRAAGAPGTPGDDLWQRRHLAGRLDRIQTYGRNGRCQGGAPGIYRARRLIDAPASSPYDQLVVGPENGSIGQGRATAATTEQNSAVLRSASRKGNRWTMGVWKRR